jgi:hypothetical protein
MNTVSRILSVAAVAAWLFVIERVRAQAVADDGIAVSPKVRQELDRPKASAAVAGSQTNVGTCEAKSGRKKPLASPDGHGRAAQHKGPGGASACGNVADSRVGGGDCIAASPKLRQQLDERARRYQGAPVK